MTETDRERLERLLDEAEAVAPDGYSTVDVTLPGGLPETGTLGFVRDPILFERVETTRNGRTLRIRRDGVDRVEVFWGDGSTREECGTSWYASAWRMSEEQEAVYHSARVGGLDQETAENVALQEVPTGTGLETYCTLLEDGTDPDTALDLVQHLGDR